MASFSELDPTEAVSGKHAEDMSADELMVYFKESQKRINDLDIAIRPYADFKIFEQLIKDYPQPRAGRIVKWLFFRHKGKETWDKRMQVVRISQLSGGWRWMAEQWSVQYQMYLRREERQKTAASTPSKFMTSL